MLALAVFYLSCLAPFYVTPATVRADAAGNFYIAGTYQAIGLPLPLPSPGVYQPTPAGRSNGYIVKYSADGQPLWTTFLGGSQRDDILSLSLDADSNLYITGTTTSPDFPITSGSLRDVSPDYPQAFVAKLSPNGDRLLYSAILGGTYGASPSSLAVDRDGHVTVTGTTQSSDFPLTPGALQTTLPTLDFAPASLSASILTALRSTTPPSFRAAATVLPTRSPSTIGATPTSRAAPTRPTSLPPPDSSHPGRVSVPGAAITPTPGSLSARFPPVARPSPFTPPIPRPSSLAPIARSTRAPTPAPPGPNTASRNSTATSPASSSTR